MTSLIHMKMEMNYESSILATPTKGKNFPYLDNERFPGKKQLLQKDPPCDFRATCKFL